MLLQYSAVPLPSFWISFLLLLSSISFSACLATSRSSGNTTDRLALLQFKSRITTDPSGVLKSWNDTSHFCHWPGITCSPRHLQRVSILDLSGLGLEGSISPHIGNLSFLTEIYLGGNKLFNEIPPQLGRLKRLRMLVIHHNSLTGTIPPALSNCSNLLNLSIGYNQLVGEIPTELGSLKKLRLLSVNINFLTGKIPPSIGNLSSLDRFYAGRNYLHGIIPDSLGHLMNIQFLSLLVNNLSGTIPPSIFNNLSTVVVLDFSSNKLIGSLPSDMFTTLPSLQSIGLVSNFLSGSIPATVSNASNLLKIGLADNQFSGAVPSLAKLYRLQLLSLAGNLLGTGGVDDDLNFLASLVNSTELQWVYIGENSFGGKLPEIISNFSTSLARLWLDYVEVSGKIPHDIGNLVNLEILVIANTRISGSIPGGIGKLQNLVQLYLDDNRLTGNLPASIGNLKNLTELNVSRNKLQGPIPPTLGMLRGLTLLDLSSNNFTGSIPKEIFDLSSLSLGLDLSRNNLTGSLPVEVGNLKNMGTLIVSENKLSGNIPSTLGECASLEALYMEGNNFQGTIPSSLNSLRGLSGLDLSTNNLSGEIPKFLEDFVFLQLLNLSYNSLEGAVPTDGVFKNASAAFLMGNKRLCGGLPEFHLPECIFQESDRNWGNANRHATLKLVVSIVCVVCGVSLFALLLYIFLFKKKRQNTTASGSSHNFLLNLSYNDILRATDGFSEENLIGSGAFGSVYKGILHGDEARTVIAIKVLNLFRHGAAKSFLSECEALRNIRHRNLVKVLTACSSVDSNGNDFKAIVFELMANGSLENWKHRSLELEDGSCEAPSRHLNLLQRLNIAIDVACAVDYLHNHCETPVVHCDLKPSNILLDEDMVAHVGDFGLARFTPEATTQIQAYQSSSIGIKGSTGYIAPEYGMGSEVSREGDVYSYGIILLEIFTGKRPTDEMFGESMNLHKFAEGALSGEVEDIADAVLLDELAEEHQVDHRTRLSAHVSATDRRCKIRGCLVSIFQIGVACSVESPTDRMTIANVVAELNSIKRTLKLKDEMAEVVVDRR